MELKTNCPQSISILYVEDEELTLKLQSTLLAKKFPDIVLYTAINGRQGLELFKAHKPEIVITDVNMSELSGVQMAEKILALKPDTKIIAITGKSGKSSETDKDIMRSPDGKMVGFDRVLNKPIDVSELFGVIEQSISEIRQRIS